MDNVHELNKYEKLIKDFEDADFWVEISSKRREDVITHSKGYI